MKMEEKESKVTEKYFCRPPYRVDKIKVRNKID